MWANGYSFPKNWSNFMARRILRIEPPYLLSIAVTLLVLTVAAANKGSSFSIDWLNVLGHVGYLNVFNGKAWILGVYWTLAVEFQYYLMISLFFPLLFMGDLRKNIVAILILLAVSIPITKLLNDEGFISRHIPLFLAGIVVFKYYTKILNLGQFLPLSLLILAAIYYEFGILYTLSSVFTAAMIMLNVDIKWRFMYFLGKISYSLYLMHWIFGVEIAMKTLQYLVPAPGTFLKIGITLLAIAAAIGLSYLYYLLIEKPAIRWAKNFKKV